MFGFIDKLKSGLSKTRVSLTEKIEQLVVGYAKIDENFLEELEEILLKADIGVETTLTLMKIVRDGIKKKEINNVTELKPFLQGRIFDLIYDEKVSFATDKGKPYVILVVGVNGTGKTTTIAKLANIYKKEGKKVLVAAADTFRAAAIEQIEMWSKKIGIDIVKHKEGADPSAVVFDAMQAAKARNIDILIIDTAGRLHTKANLMEELKKMKRVIARELENAPHETLLVVDSTTGQNAVSQTKLFSEATALDGIVLTKLDGTAKGGVIITINHELKIPVKWIGLGEKMEDLRQFDAGDFMTALFADTNKVLKE